MGFAWDAEAASVSPLALQAVAAAEAPTWGELILRYRCVAAPPVNPEREMQTQDGLEQMPEPEEKCQQPGGAAGGWCPGEGSSLSSTSGGNLFCLHWVGSHPHWGALGERLVLPDLNFQPQHSLASVIPTFLFSRKTCTEGRAAPLTVSGLGRKIASCFTPFAHYANAHLLNASFPSRIPAGPSS